MNPWCMLTNNVQKTLFKHTQPKTERMRESERLSAIIMACVYHKYQENELFYEIYTVFIVTMIHDKMS